MPFSKTISKLNKLGIIALMASFLAGCIRYDEAGQPSGIVYDFIGRPLANLLIWIANQFDGNYALAIIILTVVVQIVLLPLRYNQLKGSVRQQYLMRQLQPHLQDIQERQKNAESQEEQMMIAQEMQELYKINNINPMGGIGCLPLLIQLPIISSVYAVVRFTPEIQESYFMGISLGERSIPLVIIAGLVYLVQAWFTLQGVPEEQRKQMQGSLMMSPIMIVIISWSGPAALSLYWIAGGIIQVFFSFFQNNVMKPKIHAQVDAELEENPIKVPEKRGGTNRSSVKDVTPKSTKEVTDSKSQSNRNKGKQNRK